MDFLEIMDICAYDIDDAKEMANRCCSTDVVEEVLSEVGLEKIQPESASTGCWRLRRPGGCTCSWC